MEGTGSTLTRGSLVLFVGCLFVSVAMAQPAPTPPPAPPLPAAPAVQTIKGSVLKVDDQQLVLKDRRGREVRLQLDQETRMEPVHVGDTVTAEVTADGHAESVQVTASQTPGR